MNQEKIKKLTADLLRTATVMKIKQDALDAATPRKRRAIMVVPSRSIGRVSRYLVRRCC
jgi:hypothetical protein